ncbi:MAG: hypothetical protein KGZ43_11555 [Sulfuritalea sp.]|nr:hypothetical protein [Sulfuritalea sp.]
MAARQADERKVLVVVGMHRSGTSATTGALRCLGVSLGDRLYAGHRGINDKGYFEHSDIADTNDEVLWQTEAGMSISAHTVSHPILVRHPDAAARQEIADSR